MADDQNPGERPLKDVLDASKRQGFKVQLPNASALATLGAATAAGEGSDEMYVHFIGPRLEAWESPYLGSFGPADRVILFDTQHAAIDGLDMMLAAGAVGAGACIIGYLLSR